MMVKTKNSNNVFWDFQCMWDANEAVIRNRTLNACITKAEKSQINNPNFNLKKLEKAR